MKLRGVYRHPGDHDEWHFSQWFKRTQGRDIELAVYYKVAVSMKHGKRRKLKSMKVRIFMDGGCGDPQCCPSYRRITFETPTCVV